MDTQVFQSLTGLYDTTPFSTAQDKAHKTDKVPRCASSPENHHLPKLFERYGSQRVSGKTRD